MFGHCWRAYKVARRYGLFRYFTVYRIANWLEADCLSNLDDVIYKRKLHGWVLRFRTPARKCMAMGLHPRLGEECKLNMLLLDMIRLILDFHCPVDVDLDDETLARLTAQ